MKRLFLLLTFLTSIAFGTTLEENLAEHIQYSDTETNYVGHIYIGDHQTQIAQGTYVYVKNAVEHLVENYDPIFIILELDTPGGQVFAAQKISDLLKELDTQEGVPVVAYINNWAISAGAMLAYSSRYITTVKDGSMGAAAPVTQQGQATSEKVNSAIRADFANRAAFFDRNPLIAEAMVDADLVLIWKNGRVVELSSNDEIKKGDEVITRKGKLLTLNAEEMVKYGVADLRLLPEKLEPITKAEKSAGKWPASKSLLFKAPFFNKIPQAEIVSYQMDWKTRFFTILSNPIVTSLLFLGLMLCFYIEISTPGFGIAGGLGLVFLGLIILASFAIQAASWLEFILLGAGVVLILIEVFVIPGFGIVGIIGIFLTIAGIFALLLPGIRDISFDFDTNTLNAAGEYILERLAWLCGTLVVGAIVIAILAKYLLPRLTLLSPIVSRGEQDADKGYVAGLSKEELPAVGAEGVVVSSLRPAGKIEIDDELYDAVSSGKYIDKGEAIVVVDIDGNRVVVERKI